MKEFHGKLNHKHRKEEIIPEIQDVIFLGAGASAAEGAPLQTKLFLNYFVAYQLEDRNIYHTMDRDLATFFSIFFGIDIDNGDLKKRSFPTFEEVLGVLELALKRNESFRHYGIASDSPMIQKIREHLILLIAEILDKTLKEQGVFHARLINHLLHSDTLLSTCFVSLNYDILVDNALSRLRESDGIDLDYGVRFTNPSREKDWSLPLPGHSVSLFKLHGSLNWLYCPTCVSLTLTPKQKGVINLKWKVGECICPTCETLTIPIIIPPTFFKVMDNYFLQNIWKGVEEKLMSAKRIFFCGYSFPDADIHIKYLLKRVEINRGSTPSIFIINNHAGKDPEQAKIEEQRFVRFFRDPTAIRYTELSFEEFSEIGPDGVR